MALENVHKCKRQQRDLGQHGSLLNGLSLGPGNGPDEDTKHSLGDDISDGVTNLLSALSGGTGNADVLDDVHEWVGQPRHSGQHAGMADQSACCLRLSLCGLSETDEELLNNEGEWDHGKGPPQPALSEA